MKNLYISGFGNSSKYMIIETPEWQTKHGNQRCISCTLQSNYVYYLALNVFSECETRIWSNYLHFF